MTLPGSRLSASAEAHALFRALPASSKVGRAAAALAAELLEFAERPPGWIAEHELVRDIGVRQERERLVEATAGLLGVAVDCLRALAAHGGTRTHDGDVVRRAREFTVVAADALGAMARIESELTRRLEEPTLTECSLETRRRAIQSDPTPQLERIKRLSLSIEALDGRQRELAEEERSHQSRHDALESSVTELTARLKSAEERNSSLERRLHEVERMLASEETRRSALAVRLEGSEARLADVRSQLRELEADPRRAILVRVARAMQALDAAAEDAGNEMEPRR